MKHEWRKHEKELYNTKKDPIIIKIPKQKFLIISGVGNPNNEDFSDRVGALMSLAYPIKMNFKEFSKNNPDSANEFDYTDYTVYPLEGLWTSDDADTKNKDAYKYKIMVRQPDFVTHDMFDAALESAKKKKPSDLLREVSFGEIEDGLSAQILHLGSYDDEPASFEKMDEFIKKHDYTRSDVKIHREIYLSDVRKIEQSKLKTLLRYGISSL